MPASARRTTFVVTGASSGIGYETALGLARTGARVGIVGRDRARTEAAARAIHDLTGSLVETFVGDLAEQSEVRRLAGEIRAQMGELNGLINNAGAIFDERAVTSDGIERTWALDHLAPVLLTLSLLDLLKANAPSRIVNVSSVGHKHGRIDVDDLQAERSYKPMARYCQAKLGNVLFTNALARRLDGTGVTVNAVHPGLVASGFGLGSGGGFGLFWRLFRPFAAKPADGARTSIYAATADELDGVTGRYFAKSRQASSSPASRDRNLQERVWALSLRQVGLTDAVSEVAE